jgi:hypothetical protein
MKKLYVTVAYLLLFGWAGKAQTQPDSLPKVRKTTLDIVYGHYFQNGNNSAVTGGVGTEELMVYGPNLTVKHTRNKVAFSLNSGIDLISSASTDKIDFVVSSASSRDFRAYFNGTAEVQIPKQNLTIYGGGGISFESDYWANIGKIGFVKENKNKLTTYSGQFQVSADDLRWGRFRYDRADTKKLIYPKELRTREWYDTYRRASYQLKLSLTQVLNQRNIIGIFPELAYQKGLLATPFHRVYFNDNSLRVENLPAERWKSALAVRWNTFVGGNWVLKNTIDAYRDNWGIVGIAFENETSLKLKNEVMLLANARFYTQSSSPYFNAYQRHLPTESFYTSDFDLSRFELYQIGTGIKFKPYRYWSKKMVFNFLIFRYNFMYRSNGLQAHILSLSMQMDYWHKSKKKQMLNN